MDKDCVREKIGVRGKPYGIVRVAHNYRIGDIGGILVDGSVFLSVQGVKIDLVRRVRKGGENVIGGAYFKSKTVNGNVMGQVALVSEVVVGVASRNEGNGSGVDQMDVLQNEISLPGGSVVASQVDCVVSVDSAVLNMK